MLTTAVGEEDGGAGKASLSGVKVGSGDDDGRKLGRERGCRKDVGYEDGGTGKNSLAIGEAVGGDAVSEETRRGEGEEELLARCREEDGREETIEKEDGGAGKMCRW